MASYNSRKNELNLIRDGYRNSGRKYRGVTRVPSGRWTAKIEKKGFKRMSIGTYDSDVEAALSYDRMARILHGTRAILNFPYYPSPVRGLASGSAFANIPGETPVVAEVSLPVEISDCTLLDANTDAKPQNLMNVPSNDFSISDDFFNNLWS